MLNGMESSFLFLNSLEDQNPQGAWLFHHLKVRDLSKTTKIGPNFPAPKARHMGRKLNKEKDE